MRAGFRDRGRRVGGFEAGEENPRGGEPEQSEAVAQLEVAYGAGMIAEGQEGGGKGLANVLGDEVGAGQGADDGGDGAGQLDRRHRYKGVVAQQKKDRAAGAGAEPRRLVAVQKKQAQRLERGDDEGEPQCDGGVGEPEGGKGGGLGDVGGERVGGEGLDQPEKRERHEGQRHPRHVLILRVDRPQQPGAARIENCQCRCAQAVGGVDPGKRKIAGENPRIAHHEDAEVLEGEKAELPAGQQIEQAGEVLVKRGDAEGIDGAVEGEVGLADKDRKNAGAELQDKIRQHVGIPKGIAGADLPRGRKRVE